MAIHSDFEPQSLAADRQLHPDTTIALALEHLVARGWRLAWQPDDRVLLAPPGEELGDRASWSLDQAVAIAGLVGFTLPPPTTGAGHGQAAA